MEMEREPSRCQSLRDKSMVATFVHKGVNVMAEGACMQESDRAQHSDVQHCDQVVADGRPRHRRSAGRDLCGDGAWARNQLVREREYPPIQWTRGLYVRELSIAVAEVEPRLQWSSFRGQLGGAGEGLSSEVIMDKCGRSKSLSD